MIPLAFRYSLASIMKNNPNDFFPLLLHGTTKSTLFDWLLVSQSAITGIPTLPASSTAFLSGQGSVTKTIFFSMKFFKEVFVNIPGGYLLETINISSGL